MILSVHLVGGATFCAMMMHHVPFCCPPDLRPRSGL